jgi:ABC-type dipeptide/oligopeptide/nickel transport system permease component
MRLVGGRLVQAFVLLLLMTIVVFFMTHVLGDPVRHMLPQNASRQEYLALRRALGFDRPLWTQYTSFIRGAVTGNFGISTQYNLPALQVLLPSIRVTLILSISSLVLSVVVGIPIGILAGYFPNSLLDRASQLAVTLGQAVPVFVVGVLLIQVFAVRYHLLPAGALASWTGYVLPAVSLSLWAMASLTKLTRSVLREVLLQPYVLLARAKGLSEPRIIVTHCMRNISAPLLSYGALLLGGLLTGAVITEELFDLPGFGVALLNAVQDLDFNVIQAGVALTAFAFVVVNLAAELLQAALDPRARLQISGKARHRRTDGRRDGSSPEVSVDANLKVRTP